MTEFSLTTPALLFPAISLLLLAYTNRFLHLAALIRDLHARYRDTREPLLKQQIEQLRRRVILIRYMQWLGTASIFGCVLCMLVVFEGFTNLGRWIFALSLALMLLSLWFSMWEIQLSIGSLNLVLSDLESPPHDSKSPALRAGEAKRETGDMEANLENSRGRFP